MTTLNGQVLNAFPISLPGALSFAPSVPATNASLNVPGKHGSGWEISLAYVYTNWNVFPQIYSHGQFLHPLEVLVQMPLSQ